MAFVFITNYFFDGPLFMPTWFEPSMSPRFRRYLYPFNVTQIDRVIKIFILLRTNGRTNISMIYNLTLYVLFQGQYTRGVNSDLGVLIMLILGQGCFHPIGCRGEEGHSKGDPVQHPVTLHSLEQNIRMKKPNLQQLDQSGGLIFYLYLYSPLYYEPIY